MNIDNWKPGRQQGAYEYEPPKKSKDKLTVGASLPQPTDSLGDLDNLLADLASTMFCRGQDWQPGDSIVSGLDAIEETSAAIQAYCEQQCNLARLEALESFRDYSHSMGSRYWHGDTRRTH